MKSKTLHIIDAKGRSLGRVASEAATYLRGKHDPDFLPHIIPNQKVIIKNASRVRVTGDKMDQKEREHYSGYPGGLKKISYRRTFNKNPALLIQNAVSGMLPRNKLKKEIMKHLTIYVGDE